MLPLAPKDVGRLSDVFVSALGSIAGGELNRLKLPRVQSAVVVLIDGLGYENLLEHTGHARNLAALLKNPSSAAIRCGFPSTTAVSLTSFGTGLRAGMHGVLGYQLKTPQGGIRNMLNGWRPTDNPREWQVHRTIAENATAFKVSTHMVASPEYEGSGFSQIIMGGAEFAGIGEIRNRVRHADRLARKKGSLVYLYFAELDQAAHRFGTGSPEWTRALEEIDSALAELSGEYGFIVTADHGIVDVPASQHVYLDAIDGFAEAVTLAVGDPRALFCYGDKARAEAALAGVAVYVTTFEELHTAGWVAGKETIDELPDFVIVSKGQLACYDRRTAKPQSLKMIGQHGGIDDRETRVPLLRGGLYS